MRKGVEGGKGEYFTELRFHFSHNNSVHWSVAYLERTRLGLAAAAGGTVIYGSRSGRLLGTSKSQALTRDSSITVKCRPNHDQYLKR